ncbi:MAG: hypothetical protein ACT4QA_17345 [Panacagrimonas sp.]
MKCSILLFIAALVSCSSHDGSDAPPPAVRESFDFAQGAQQWVAGFADYPAGAEGFYELIADYRMLPPELGGDRGALFITGNNHSDDLFMYYKRRVDGLDPGRRYTVRFQVEIATEVPTGCTGIGGSPGDSVYLKAGVAGVEPVAVANLDGFNELNVDKGVQSNAGPAALVLGTIATTRVCDDGRGFELKMLDSGRDSLAVTADVEGSVWLLVGTDSGFEGSTRLYYTRFAAEFLR